MVITFVSTDSCDPFMIHANKVTFKGKFVFQIVSVIYDVPLASKNSTVDEIY